MTSFHQSFTHPSASTPPQLLISNFLWELAPLRPIPSPSPHRPYQTDRPKANRNDHAFSSLAGEDRRGILWKHVAGTKKGQVYARCRTPGVLWPWLQKRKAEGRGRISTRVSRNADPNPTRLMGRSEMRDASRDDVALGENSL
ncbi:hypothetical protein VTH06DRAFT_858 [Thermothelomyces fergusii]